MTKTKKRFHHRSLRQPSRMHRFSWLLVGLFLGVLSTIGFSLYTENTWLQWMPAWFSNPVLSPKNPPIEESTPDEPRKSAQGFKKEQRDTSAELDQRFEFYQLLPGMEVQLPDPKDPVQSHTSHKPMPKTLLSPKSNATQPKITDKARHKPIQRHLAAAGYIIQAGAYRQRMAAEKLKNRLTQQGFKTRIQAVEAEDGAWFRVTLGPFANESMALQQKKRLQKHQIHGILILQRS